MVPEIRILFVVVSIVQWKLPYFSFHSMALYYTMRFRSLGFLFGYTGLLEFVLSVGLRPWLFSVDVIAIVGRCTFLYK